MLEAARGQRKLIGHAVSEIVSCIAKKGTQAGAFFGFCAWTLPCRPTSSQRILMVAKCFILVVTSHGSLGQVDGLAEKEIASQPNRAFVELLTSDMGDLMGDGSLEYAASGDTDIFFLFHFGQP